MSLKSRIAAFCAAVLTVAGLVVGVATPAQAWSYCNWPYPQGLVTFTDNQGYCTQASAQSWSVLSFPSGHCFYLGAWRDWAGSVINFTGRSIIISDSGTCTGTSQGLPAHTSDPDLYAGVNLGNKVGSFAVY